MGRGSQRITIALGNTNLRLLAASKASVTAWADVPFNPNLMRGDSVADPAGMGQVIHNAVSRSGFQAGKVIAAIPGTRSLSRLVPLPKAKDINPEEVIPRQARRLMGAAVVDNSHLYWKLLRQEQTQDIYYVLAAPKDASESFAEAMRFAQLKPELLELTGFALARVVNEQNAVIAGADTRAIDLVIVTDYIPVFMMHAVSESPIFSGEDAAPVLESELARVIGYYNDRNPDKQLAESVPIYVLGPYAGDEHVTTVIKGSTGHPVVAMKPPSWISYPQDFPYSSFAANLGLILKDM